MTEVRGATLDVDTGSGDVRVALLQHAASLSVETGSGDVTVSVPEGFGAEADIETGSGGIHLSGLTIRATRIARDHVSGTIGDGRGRLQIETGSGSVRLTRATTPDR